MKKQGRPKKAEEQKRVHISARVAPATLNFIKKQVANLGRFLDGLAEDSVCNSTHRFYIDCRGEFEVGVMPTLDVVTISVPKFFDDTEDFKKYFKAYLSDYYDGDFRIYCEDEWKAIGN